MSYDPPIYPPSDEEDEWMDDWIHLQCLDEVYENMEKIFEILKEKKNLMDLEYYLNNICDLLEIARPEPLNVKGRENEQE